MKNHHSQSEHYPAEIPPTSTATSTFGSATTYTIALVETTPTEQQEVEDLVSRIATVQAVKCEPDSSTYICVCQKGCGMLPHFSLILSVLNF